MTLISAHRCGSGNRRDLENSRELLIAASELDCEYVEFDVQRCLDGQMVLFHDDFIELSNGVERRVDSLTFQEYSEAVGKPVKYQEALELLKGKSKAHIDFKFRSPQILYQKPAQTYEVEAVQKAIEILGVDQIIITSLEDDSVRVVREWAVSLYPDLLVGLSLGLNVSEMSLAEKAKTRLREIFPARRFKSCHANLVVANKSLARLTLARFAHKRKLPLLVWTVDKDQELGFWLNNSDVWLLTTNFPKRALEIRGKA